MGVNWTLYEDLLGWGSDTTQRETNIHDSLENFYNGILDDPSYQESSTVNDVVQPLAITRKSALQCDVIAMPGESFCIGDIIGCFNEHWIVVNAYNDPVGLTRGKIWLCNYSISFQNHSPTIYTRYCVIDDGRYSKRSDPDAFVMTNTYKMYLPMDEQTIQLYVDKRLSFGEIFNQDGDKILEVYKAVGMDIRSENIGACSHIVVLTLQRDVYDPANDSIALNVCDVISLPDDEDTPGGSGKCSISGSNFIRIGTSKMYTASFIDANGDEVNNVTPVWTVNMPSGLDIEYCITSAGTCVVSAPFKTSYVGEQIEISVTDSDGVYGDYTMTVEVVTVG